MAFVWRARIHKSGSSVQVFDGDRFVREVKASAETFEPAEAKEFAQALISELQTKSAAQMEQPAAAPSVTTKAELKDVTQQEVAEQATGAHPETMEMKQDEEAPVSSDEEKQAETSSSDDDLKEARKVIASLKQKLVAERNDRLMERKARRGLAIAKQMVANGELDDSFDTIKAKVAEISKLETPEIERLERKVAGESEFESKEQALKEARRQKRIARLNRIAAEDAQEDGDEEAADDLDTKADVAETKAAKCLKIAQDMSSSSCDEKSDEPEDLGKDATKKVAEGTSDEGEPEDLEAQAEATSSDEKKVEAKVEEKKVETKTEEKKVEAKVEEKKAQAEATTTSEEKQDETISDEDEMKEAKRLARTYRKIAAKHRKKAEDAEAAGKTEDADKQDELADEAEEKADDIENQLQQMGYVADANELKSAQAETSTSEEKQAEETSTSSDEKKEAKKVEAQEATTTSEEKQDEATSTSEEKQAEETSTSEEEKQDETSTSSDEGKTAKKAHAPLKRIDESGKEASIIDGFGFDKSASLVEQNEFTNSPEVEKLASMWRGAPKE